MLHTDNNSESLPSFPTAQSADFDALNMMMEFCETPLLFLPQITKSWSTPVKVHQPTMLLLSQITALNVSTTNHNPSSHSSQPGLLCSHVIWTAAWGAVGCQLLSIRDLHDARGLQTTTCLTHCPLQESLPQLPLLLLTRYKHIWLVKGVW